MVLMCCTGTVFTYIQNCEQKGTMGIVKQCLRYLPDILTSYQSKSKAIQSQVQQYVSLAIKNPEKTRIPASTL